MNDMKMVEYLDKVLKMAKASLTRSCINCKWRKGSWCRKNGFMTGLCEAWKKEREEM